MTVIHPDDPGFDPDSTPKTEIAKAVLDHPRVIYQADQTCKALVLALKDELLVRRSLGDEADYDRLAHQLSPMADRVGALSDEAVGLLPAGDDVEIWLLKDPHTSGGDAISVARSVRTEHTVQVPGHDPVVVPTVSPNHVCVVCGYDMCPGGPPRLLDGRSLPNIEPIRRDEQVDVVVVDSGYVPVHPLLDQRGVTAEPGRWFDPLPLPESLAIATKLKGSYSKLSPGWRDSPPDNFDTYLDKLGRPRLPGVAGHGTFVGGIVAAGCPEAGITVVGHRHECLPVDWKSKVDKLRLFTSEIAIARSIMKHKDADVISCGFAFPILDGLGSIPFTVVVPAVNSRTALIAPAGNEESVCPHWPAAHPLVTGVGATNSDGATRADFSNWGTWLECCSPGVDVVSAFASVVVLPQDYSPTDDETPWSYDYWAAWSGTSFAAPKVAAAVAREAVANPAFSARDHASTLLSGALATVSDYGVQLPFVA
jgi:subtilisin family serine protease